MSGKHLSYDERLFIEHALNKGISLTKISKALSRATSTISREVKKHRVLVKKAPYGRTQNCCIHRTSCSITNICLTRYCRFSRCSGCIRCNSLCKKFEEELCPLLSRPPYVCNSCKKSHRCTLHRQIYEHYAAHKEYKETL